MIHDHQDAHACQVSETDYHYDFISEANQQGYQAICKRFIQQFEQELREVISLSDNKGKPRLDLLEVMCSDQSELVNQAQKIGLRAQRFGLAEKKEHRMRLFHIMWMRRPKNLWYSPECGPWGKFSNLNMGKSWQGLQDGLQKRMQSLWQISL